MNKAGVPVGIEKRTDLKSIEKIESIASSDYFYVVGEKEFRVEDDGRVLSNG